MAPKQADPAHLTPGSIVEVAPPDDGLDGSWYVAKVIKRARKNTKTTPSKYLIEYTTLFQDEAGMKPLRESLDAVRIRPVQPEGNGTVGRGVFRVGDAVDAYHNDGWWEGKVSNVWGDYGEKKYEVYFGGSDERIVFGVECLRVSRVWDNGIWIPPFADEEEEDNWGRGHVEEDGDHGLAEEDKGRGLAEEDGGRGPVEEGKGNLIGKKRKKVNSGEENSAKAEAQEKMNAGEENSGKAEEQEKLVLPSTHKRDTITPKHPEASHLKPGSAVEISSDDAGFRGSWFIGTIIRCLCKKKPAKYLVEYKTLFEDEAGQKPLRETLYEYQLRPVQPPEKRPRVFKFGDEVDAYLNDGWWEGDITGELGGDRFNVYFRPAKEQLEFGKESLRIHREWLNGAWHPPIEDEDEGTAEKEEDEKKCRKRSFERIHLWKLLEKMYSLKLAAMKMVLF